VIEGATADPMLAVDGTHEMHGPVLAFEGQGGGGPGAAHITIATNF
jgi:hypothetical protein